MILPGATGTINTQNLNVASGVPTPSSFVQLGLGQSGGQSDGPVGASLDSSVTQIAVSVVAASGTGALTARATADGVNWVALSGSVFTNMNTGAVTSTIPSGATGLYLMNAQGYQAVRINAEAAVTNSYSVSLNPSNAIVAASQPSGTGAWSITQAVAQSNSDTAVLARPGFLLKVLITTLGTAALSIYDNASAGSGTVVGYIPASTPVGTVIQMNSPCVNGICTKGAASQPAFTAYYYGS